MTIWVHLSLLAHPLPQPSLETARPQSGARTIWLRRQPQNVLQVRFAETTEEIWTSEIVEAEWEIMRLRRYKSLWPKKFRILRSTFCAIELFPFMHPKICATEYFGGIEINIWT
jgi:hypothetical protein